MSPLPQIRIARDEEELRRSAAGEIAGLMGNVLVRRDRFSLCLTGGQTPEKLYELLARPPFHSLPWQRVHFFWGDERFVPPDHPDSNYLMAKRSLLDRISVPAANVHPMPTENATPPEAARSYEKTLRDFFGGLPRFDLVLLGLGEDGHVASLFPGFPQVSETERWVLPVEGSPKPPPERLTLTLPVINNARRVFFFAAGARKSAVLGRVFGEPSLELPAQLVRPAEGDPVWWLDKEAAAGGFRAS